MLVITMEVDVPDALSLAAKERIAMDLDRYGAVRVVNIEVKNAPTPGCGVEAQYKAGRL